MKACETIDQVTNQCLQWVDLNITLIPELTDEARDQLLLLVIGTYFSILLIRTVRSLFSKQL